MSKTNLLHLTRNHIEESLEKLEQPSFRTKQIVEWLYKHQVGSISEMTNLSKDLRDSLSSKFEILRLKTSENQTSLDGTKKYIFEAEDGVKFETVGIPALKSGEKYETSRGDELICADRKEHFCNRKNVDSVYTEVSNNNITDIDPNQNEGLTVCVSSQAGCKMGCNFCATGKQKFYRNLFVGEIVQQVLFVQNDFNQRVSNIVVMGQGEPFLNYENVLEALRILNDSRLVGIGARKITVSTCGIIEGINRFATEPFQFGLAVSLHCCIQSIRNKLMPGVKNFNLEKLKCSLIDYQTQTKRRITFEYLLIKGVNDSSDCLNSLYKFCDGLKCHVNLLSYNPVDECQFDASDKSTITLWEESLRKRGVNTTYRKSRGQDIDGACGQLINK